MSTKSADKPKTGAEPLIRNVDVNAEPLIPNVGAGAEPRVAVIIPNFNGEEYLAVCLSSILAQTYSNYSVTVVDNASSDASVELVKREFPQVEVVENRENTGYSGGCNAGLQHAQRSGADYFVLVNSDVRAERDWLVGLVRAAEGDPRIGICQSLILLAGDTVAGVKARQGGGGTVASEHGDAGHSADTRRAADSGELINSAGNEAHYLGFGYCGHYLEPDRGQFTGVIDVPFASGSSLLVRRELLEEIGRFDEDLFMYQEDLDLCWRARIAGWRVVLAPASRIHHYYSFSRNKLKFYYLERNRLIVGLKCYSGRSLLVLAPAFIGAEAAMLAYSLAGGWFGQKLKGYLYLIRNIDRIMAKRRAVRATRRVPDSEIARFWTDRMGFADLADSPMTRLANPVSAAYWAVARRLL